MAEQDLLPGNRVQRNSSGTAVLSLLLAVLGYKSPGGVSIQPRSLEVPPDRYQMAPAVSFGWPLYIPQYCLYWAQDCDT